MAGSIERIRNTNTYRLTYIKNGVKYRESIKADNKKEAQLMLADFVQRVDKGNYINTNYKFVEYTQLWLDTVARPNFSPVTVRRYISYLNNRILPVLGAYELKDITPLIINDFYNVLKTSDCARGGKLADTSVKRIANIVSSILQNAYLYGLIDNNPCHRVKLTFAPKVKEDKIHYYDRNTYKHVLELLKKESLAHRTIIELALKSGLRRSEMWRFKI